MHCFHNLYIEQVRSQWVFFIPKKQRTTGLKQTSGLIQNIALFSKVFKIVITFILTKVGMLYCCLQRHLWTEQSDDPDGIRFYLGVNNTNCFDTSLTFLVRLNIDSVPFSLHVDLSIGLSKTNQIILALFSLMTYWRTGV